MIKTESSVQFHFLTPCSLRSRQALRSFILYIFKKEKYPIAAINIVFCDDEYLLGLNRQFLQHDYYTDILSFPLSPKGRPLEAEIYISVDRVKENARAVPTSFKKELHRVIFHGILHFCGYKDKIAKEIKKMRLAEDKYLSEYCSTIA
jgi:probable rRNA maturation factor